MKAIERGTRYEKPKKKKKKPASNRFISPYARLHFEEFNRMRLICHWTKCFFRHEASVIAVLAIVRI
jgi:hypothetical protein